MQTYKVTGHIAILGVGIVLKLTKDQFSIRTQKLKCRSKNIYKVLEPVQFKQGEEITVVSGDISKAVLMNLEDISKKTARQQPETTNAPANKKPNPTPDEEDLANKDNGKSVDGNDVNNLPRTKDNV